MYSSLNIIRDQSYKNEMGGACNTYGGEEWWVLVAKPEGKRQLRRPSLRWENNIEMDLQEMGFEGMDWTDLVRNRFRAAVNGVMNLRVP